MKYLKKFENINNIEIGDYVICNEECLDSNDKLYSKAIIFSSNNIGQYVKHHQSDENFLVVQFENVPENIKQFFCADSDFENCRNMYKSEIKIFSKNKKELEAILASNKYNL